MDDGEIDSKPSNLTEVLDHHTVALENMLYAMTFTDDTPSSSVHLFQSVFYCGKVIGDSPVVFFKEQFVYGHSVIVWSRHFCNKFFELIVAIFPKCRSRFSFLKSS